MGMATEQYREILFFRPSELVGGMGYPKPKLVGLGLGRQKSWGCLTVEPRPFVAQDHDLAKRRFQTVVALPAIEPTELGHHPSNRAIKATGSIVIPQNKKLGHRISQVPEDHRQTWQGFGFIDDIPRETQQMDLLRDQPLKGMAKVLWWNLSGQMDIGEMPYSQPNQTIRDSIEKQRLGVRFQVHQLIAR
jgi:hypothetical protein